MDSLILTSQYYIYGIVMSCSCVSVLSAVDKGADEKIFLFLIWFGSYLKILINTILIFLNFLICFLP